MGLVITLNSENGMLVIDDDLENSYDELADDIEDLQDEGKIFVINNDTTHKNILYIADVQLPEEFLGPLNETTKYVSVFVLFSSFSGRVGIVCRRR